MDWEHPTDVVPVEEFQDRLPELLKAAEHEDRRIVITREGTPIVVLTSYGDLWGLEETLDIMKNPEAVESLKRAEAEDEAGLAEPLEKHFPPPS